MSEIQSRIERFVSDIEVLIRQAALESVEQALQASSASGKPFAMGMLASGPNGSARVKGARRTAEDLVQVMASLHGYIRKNPGQRMEQIAEGMGVPSRELTLPIKKLYADGRLKTRGQKRATSYFAK